MKPDVYLQEQTLKVDRQYSKIDINEEFCVFKVVITTVSSKTISNPENTNTPDEDIVEEVFQGVSTLNAFNESLNSLSVPASEPVNFLSDKQLEMYAQHGWDVFSYEGNDFSYITYKNGAFVKEDIHDVSFSDFSLDDRISLKFKNIPFYDIVLEKPEFIKNLFFFDYQDMFILDMEGIPQPVGIIFNNISGHLHSGLYNLDKVIEWFKTRDGVIITNSASQINIDNIIHSVPRYYDDDPHLDQIECVIKPTSVEMSAIYEVIKNNKSDTDVDEVIWGHNIINGLLDCVLPDKKDYWDF